MVSCLIITKWENAVGPIRPVLLVLVVVHTFMSRLFVRRLSAFILSAARRFYLHLLKWLIHLFLDMY